MSWWGEKDSNLRRLSRQIYSLIPLTARESPLQETRILLKWPKSVKHLGNFSGCDKMSQPARGAVHGDKVARMNTALPGLFAANLERAAHQLQCLRWMMLLAATMLTLLTLGSSVLLPWPLLLQAGLTLALVNALLPRFLARHSAQRVVFAGLLADILVLTELLAFSGGAANPLASLYLPPVLFAALLLPARLAWMLALLSLMAYALLFGWHLPWPLAGDDAAYAFQLHLVGMWLTFAVSVILLTSFVSLLARQLAQREAALAQAREQQLRNEQLVALGVQAAGVAHTLSTPLGTLTMLCDELACDTTAQPQWQADITLMQSQLSLCRDALAQLKAGVEPRGMAQPLCDVLAQQLQSWHSTRPDVRLAREGLVQGGPVMALDPRFWPAFFNLLNNAAEAGGGEVSLTVSVDDYSVWMVIHNRQGSLSPAQLARAGLAPLESDKPAGLGLGVMLSHVTLSHLGGEVKLDNDVCGGVRATIRLPIAESGRK